MKNRSFVVGRQKSVLLLDLLAERTGLSRRKSKELIDTRNVFVNRRRVWMARHTLKPGDVVEIAAAPRTPEGRPCRILWQDAHYLIADKLPGLLSNGPDSAESRLREATGDQKLTAVHRLDKDTSGCLLFSKNPEAFDAAVATFRDHRVWKTYHAIVIGRLDTPETTLATPIDGQPAVTHVMTFDSSPDATHVKVRIDTGRTHQIRKHLVAIHHPLLGDRSYGTHDRVTERSIEVPRQMLHASQIAFRHPFTQEQIRIDSPLPPDFHRCLKQYGLT